ncbi:RICIN domain-containing protein [Streptomyces sp. NPDC047976]|uniref:RICIN domain-containing protein n=1 Tax=Streptomyces sp. NPDC047976 TaxID=3155746 RepID=UPI0034403681
MADIPEATYQLVNVQTGKCATVAGGSTTANNHPLVQFDCDTHPSRRWFLRLVG